jgi:hypothetical protein
MNAKDRLLSTLTITSNLILLIVFSVQQSAINIINSDVLYIYSYPLDLLSWIPIRHWHLTPSPYFFPDMLLSLPVVLLTKDPTLWFIISACIPLLCFIVLASIVLGAEQRSLLSWSQRFSLATLSTLLLFQLMKVAAPLFWLNVTYPSFVFGFHFFASLTALAYHFYTKPSPRIVNNKPYQSWFFYGLFALAVYSDTLTFIYFAILTCARIILLHKNIKHFIPWLKTIGQLVIAGLFGIVFNALANHNMRKQLRISMANTTIVENFIDFYHRLGSSSVLIIIGVPLLFFVIHLLKKKRNPEFMPLALGLLLMMVFLIGKGLAADFQALRYSTIYFPAISLLLLFILPLNKLQNISNPIISLMLILISIYLLSNLPHSYQGFKSKIIKPDLARILTCPEFIKHKRGATLFASYWPAKLLFELNHRQFNLVQVNNKLAIYDWIYNPAWKKMAIKNSNPTKIYIVDDIEDSALTQILNNKRAYRACDNRLIIVN